MLIDYVIRSTAAFGGAPFGLKKCTALTSAAGGAAAGGVPGALVGGALGIFTAVRDSLWNRVS